jgi:hypothetical protein
MDAASGRVMAIEVRTASLWGSLRLQVLVAVPAALWGKAPPLDRRKIPRSFARRSPWRRSA